MKIVVTYYVELEGSPLQVMDGARENIRVLETRGQGVVINWETLSRDDDLPGVV